jgi:hypothetical protein
VTELAVQERLRAARCASGRDLSRIARQIGAREAWLRAIEDGRFGELPAGVYARSTLRAFASAVGLDPDEIVDECGSQLPTIPDPIAALARAKGLRPVHDKPQRPPRETTPKPIVTGGIGIVLAMAADACIVGGVLVVVILATLALCRVPPGALGRAAAPAFGVTASLLAASYFLLFGGIAAETPGEWIVRRRQGAPSHDGVRTFQEIAARGLRCATRDVVAIVSLGAQLANARAVPARHSY